MTSSTRRQERRAGASVFLIVLMASFGWETRTTCWSIGRPRVTSRAPEERSGFQHSPLLAWIRFERPARGAHGGRARALLALGACSCPAPAGDAGLAADSSQTKDAASDARSATSWAPPRRLVEIGSPADEQFPTLTDNGLTIYFTRTEQTGSFVVNVPYRAYRPTRDSKFGPASSAASFGTISIWDLELAPNGLEWFFWKGLGQLASSTRANLEAPWSQPTDIGFDGFSPSLSGDERSLFFVGFDNNVRVLERETPLAPWTTSGVVAVPTSFEIKSIDISADDLTLLITAASDSLAAGVHFATRSSPNDPFESPTAIPALSGAYKNARFSADETEIVASGEYAGHSELFLSVRK